MFRFDRIVSTLVILVYFTFLYFLVRFKVIESLNNMSGFIQGIAALINLALVYFIYSFSKRDTRENSFNEHNLNWFMNVMLPDFIKGIKTNVKNQKQKLNSIRTRKIVTENGVKRLRDGLWDVVQSEGLGPYNIIEIQYVQYLSYYDESLARELKDCIDEFYDSLTDRMQYMGDEILLDSEDTDRCWKDFLTKFDTHINDLEKIIYRKIILGSNNN